MWLNSLGTEKVEMAPAQGQSTKEKKNMNNLNHKQRKITNDARFRPNLDDILKKMPNLPPSIDMAGGGGVGEDVLKSIARDVHHGRRSNNTRPPSPDTTNTSTAPPKEDTDDVLAVMCIRLRTLEAQVSAWKQECKSKDEKIERLTTERDELQQTVDEMKQFLREYNLTWVGDKQPSPPPQPTSKKGSSFSLYDGAFVPPQQSAEPEPPVSEHPFELEHLRSVVRQLNSLVNTTEVVSTGNNVHERKVKKPIDLVVYADGIIVNHGPFRPYHSNLCDAFLKDVLEGYFPYEFKESHPEGVALNLIDTFAAQAHDDEKVVMTAKKQNVHSLNDTSNARFRCISQGDFLQNLPAKRVTASGKLVDVRQGVAEFMGAGKAPEAAMPFPSPGDGLALRVTRCHKLSEGPWELRLHEATATIGSLMRMLRDRLQQGGEGAYQTLELFSPLPRVVFSAMDPKRGLAEALTSMGLGVNSNLMLRCS